MGIALGVTLRHEHISLAVHQDRAERRITAGAGLFGRLVGKAKIIRQFFHGILLCYRAISMMQQNRFCKVTGWAQLWMPTTFSNALRIFS